MKKNCDAVVIGGGPAGISCGITLQKNGVSNCVLDRATFPRDKTCGGLLTEKSFALLKNLFECEDGQSPDHLYLSKVKRIMICNGTKKLVSAKLNSTLYQTKRIYFDNELVKYYRSIGGELYEGAVDYSIDYDRNVVTLANGDEIGYRYLVGADGANSGIRRHFGIKDDAPAFCVETFVPKADVDHPDILSINFGIVNYGYLWVFPVGDEFCIGLGNRFDKSLDYPAILKDFLAQIGTTKEYRIKGAFVPCGGLADQSKTPDNVLLVGDAGGLVDPLHEEGLYAALFSGIKAAQTIAVGKGKPEYLASIEKLTRGAIDGNRFQRKFFAPDIQKKFKFILRGRRGFLRFYCDHQLAWYEYSYREIRQMLKDYFLRFKR